MSPGAHYLQSSLKASQADGAQNAQPIRPDRRLCQESNYRGGNTRQVLEVPLAQPLGRGLARAGPCALPREQGRLLLSQAYGDEGRALKDGKSLKRP